MITLNPKSYMAIPIRNHLLDLIKQKENWTDKELHKALTKEDTVMTEGKFNKVLLDLETVSYTHLTLPTILLV